MKLEGFRGDANIKTWLFSIAINRSRGKFRKRNTQRALNNILQSIQRLVPFPQEMEEAALETEKDEQLWRVVDSFGDKHRIPIIPRYGHQMSIFEIAKILEVKEGTIHSRLLQLSQQDRRAPVIQPLSPNQNFPKLRRWYARPNMWDLSEFLPQQI